MDASSASQVDSLFVDAGDPKRALVQRAAERRPDAVGQPALGAHLDHQPRREVGPAQHVVHQRRRVPARIGVLDPRVAEHDGRLRRIGPVDEQDARPGDRRNRPLRPGRDRRARPAAELLLDAGAQLRGIDVARDGQHGAVRAVERLPERLQARARDLADVLRGQHPAIGMLLAEHQVCEVRVRELVRVVEARGDRGQHLVAHLAHLALREGRVQQHVRQQVETELGVLRQRRTRRGRALAGRLRIQRAADEVDRARDVVGAARLGAAAEHRRDEVGDARASRASRRSRPPARRCRS